MEIKELGRYTDAIACLHQALGEGRKSSNVDIRLMLTNVQRSQAIVRELLSSEHDQFYCTALSGMVGSLSVHAGILEQKIDQLASSQIPETDAHTPVSQGRGMEETVIMPATPSDSAQGKLQVCSQSTPTGEQPTFFDADDPYEEKLCRSREKMIESTIMKTGQVGFSDVIGLVEAKQSLHDAIIMPLDFPHLFQGGRKPWRRILLFGPPGTGKSRLAQAVSSEVNATFYSVSSGDLVSSLVGESEKLIKELFHHARNRTGQSIIFIDEIDSLCRLRNSREDDGTRRIKTELLIQMEAAERYGSEADIFLLCATNCPWDLDKAFLRRFQKRIYIPLPQRENRIQMMKLHCRGNAVDLDHSDWERLAAESEGYSGSDLATLTNGALFQPIRDLQTATNWRKSPDGNWTPVDSKHEQGVRAKMSDFPPAKVRPRNVVLEDFLEALKLHSPTVSEEELQRFAAFTACYGQCG